MKKITLFSSVLLLLTSCSQAQLGSHIIKQIDPSEYATHKGTFKVGNPYKIKGKRYHPKERYNYTQSGIASWYGDDFHGKLTANGEIYNKNDLTAAHKTLQLPSIVRVTNLENGKSIIVRVNDRGPFAHNRIIDMSERGAELLGFKNQGTSRVRIDVLGKESKEVAHRARLGRSTRGMEIAYNRGQKPKPVQLASHTQQQQAPYPQKKHAPLTPEYKQGSYGAASQGSAGIQKAAYRSIQSEPLMVPSQQMVKTVSVSPTKLYVQAASFSNRANAQRFAMSMQRYGKTAVKEVSISGRSFYRVKLGPLNDVAHADSMLSTLIADGYNDALIVVDQQG